MDGEDLKPNFDMVEKKNRIPPIKQDKIIFSRYKVKSFIFATLILFGIIGAYYLILAIIGPIGNSITSGPPPEGSPIPGDSQSLLFGGNEVNIWPFWGNFSLPTLLEVLFFAIIIVAFMLVIQYFYRSKSRKLNIYMIVLLGTLLIIFTNLISGWDVGIVNTIGGNGEIYQDAVKIINPFSFIRNFEVLQDSLTVHARTHPPGAVLIIYLFYLIFNSPGLIAIAICVVSSLVSVYFLNGLFKKFFNGEIPKYMVFLYLLLPAIQVYYLANIYAIVTTLIIGVLFFYFHENKIISIIGSILCAFLASFISFMALFIIGCLFLYEIMNLKRNDSFRRDKLFNRKGIKDLYRNSQRILFIIIGIFGIYGFLLFTLGFNYLNSFITAMAAETSQGWKLISNPFEYFTTRVKDIMDILMFFGPVLIVLCYQGFKLLKREKSLDNTSVKLYNLVLSAIITLLIIFALGAYDHGETARSAMFIYPFLLIPIAIYLRAFYNRIPKYELRLLLVVVFGQAIFMQLVGFYIW